MELLLRGLETPGMDAHVSEQTNSSTLNRSQEPAGQERKLKILYTQCRNGCLFSAGERSRNSMSGALSARRHRVQQERQQEAGHFGGTVSVQYNTLI